MSLLIYDAKISKKFVCCGEKHYFLIHIYPCLGVNYSKIGFIGGFFKEKVSSLYKKVVILQFKGVFW